MDDQESSQLGIDSIRGMRENKNQPHLLWVGGGGCSAASIEKKRMSGVERVSHTHGRKIGALWRLKTMGKWKIESKVKSRMASNYGAVDPKDKNRIISAH